MKKILVISCILLFHAAFGQSIYLKIGSNNTHYEYSDHGTEMSSEPGGSYEMGYKSFVPESSYPGLFYSVGLIVNNFNQLGGSETSLYRWRSSYMGLNGNIGFRLLESRNENFIGNLVFGTSIIKLLKGTQTINNSFYNLKASEDFNKIFIQPSIGFEGIYNVNNQILISIGYNFSKTFNFKSSGDKTFNFVNNNFFIGTYIEL